MNLNGTTIEASATLYKQFIRPMLEYGIQFMDDAGLKILQRAKKTRSESCLARTATHPRQRYTFLQELNTSKNAN
jgi:hypothetical protein